MYDAQGRPAMWLPSSSLAVVNVSYSTTGQLVGLQRGSMSERTEFDPQGRIVSRSFVDGKVWSYSYLDKVRTFKCIYPPFGSRIGRNNTFFFFLQL